jgi:ligand-binding sensor domain-containing protein/anti-sigma regulatory factor (Ser/Thr protein kinase)
MHKIRIHIIAVLLLLYCHNGLCQALSLQTIYYTTRDGLPSNSVYRTILDNRGFLWIATENGIARFDGKNFRNYTTVHGLPANEITDIFADSSNTIWITPFGKTMSYYNARKDRFENEETDSELSKIELGNTNRGNVLQQGGVAISNNERSLFIYQNRKTMVYKNLMNAQKSPPPHRVIDYGPGKYLLVCTDSLRYMEDGRIVKTSPLGINFFNSEYFNNTLYLAGRKSITSMRLNKNGNIVASKTQQLPFDVRIFCKTGKHLAVRSYNNNTYLLDTATLELKENILNNVSVRNVMEDDFGNIWISTLENGLIKIQQKRISSYIAKKEMLQNFNAVVVKKGRIIAGNNSGELYAYDGVYKVNKITLNSGLNADGWIRDILECKQGIYIASQTGSFLLDDRSLKIKKGYYYGAARSNRSPKAAIRINDSILCLGGHAVVYLYNIVTDKVIDSIAKRVTALTADNRGQVYVGSNSGLYKWEGDSLRNFGRQHRALTYHINALACTPDNFVCAGLGSDSLVILKDDKLVASIPLGVIIPGNLCKSLYSNKPGEVWLGTNKGINRIVFDYTNNVFTFSNTYLGRADGLLGDQVNDITIYNDTAYIATNEGISFLPAKLALPINNITTFITRVSISNSDTLVLSSYSLPYDNNNVTIEFAAVDLTGYYPVFEYKLNDGDWIKLESNILELNSLGFGNNKIQARAIRRDGKPSTEAAAINFFIKTPFWKSSLFWLLTTLTAFGLTIFLLQKRNRQKQRVAIEKVSTEKKLTELEMQALKAQINPHFVFNCLNSIKGFIFEKDYKQADKYLDKFSDLLRSTLDNSSSAIISLNEEVKYLDNYLQLEKLRFDEKFEYSIAVEKNIDKNDYFVPAMLLQPYVENAIRHGIRFLQGKMGQISINVTKDGNNLICRIDDNGIGRKKALALRNQMHTEYQSRGMQLSKRRADLYNIELEVIDKKDEKGLAGGTAVILKIPLTLKP